MVGHGAKFEQKIEQAIAALLSHRSIEDAAREVGISANTLQRWIKEPEFQDELRKARQAVFTHAIGRLQDAAGAAVSSLLRIMMDMSTPAATRLRAIEMVLEQAAKAGEMEDFEGRLTRLERAASSASKSPKRSAELTWVSSRPLPDAATRPAQIDTTHIGIAATGGEVIE